MFAFPCQKITNFLNIGVWIKPFLNRIEKNNF